MELVATRVLRNNEGAYQLKMPFIIVSTICVEIASKTWSLVEQTFGINYNRTEK